MLHATRYHASQRLCSSFVLLAVAVAEPSDPERRDRTHSMRIDEVVVLIVAGAHTPHPHPVEPKPKAKPSRRRTDARDPRRRPNADGVRSFVPTVAARRAGGRRLLPRRSPRPTPLKIEDEREREREGRPPCVSLSILHTPGDPSPAAAILPSASASAIRRPVYILPHPAPPHSVPMASR